MNRRSFLRKSAAYALALLGAGTSARPAMSAVPKPLSLPVSPLVSEEKALGACLTNARLRKMVLRFEAKSEQSSTLHMRLRRLHDQHRVYFRQLREFYNLDAASGWLGREFSTD